MKVVILGATGGMGRALARRLVERGDQLFLLGIGAEDLARSAADLSLRSSTRTEVAFAECDLERPDRFDEVLSLADTSLGGFDTVIVTAALFGTGERLEEDTAFAHRLLVANFANTVAFCELARKRLLARGGGTLCVFSSVAGDRGRKPVFLYGASKAGLSTYLEGLDHRFRAEGLITVCVKPGFVKTAMTEGLKPPPFAGEPDEVAALVVRAIDRKSPVVYAPRMWALVMFVIRALPRFIMRKVGF